MPSSNEPTVVLRGRVATPLGYKPGLDGRPAFAHFRLATTPSRWDPVTGAWRDGLTQWYTVKLHRATAENARASLRKGDPVVVTGRLLAEEWTNDKGEVLGGLSIVADTLGHDLRYGHTHFTRPAPDQEPRPTSAPVDVTALTGLTEPDPDQGDGESDQPDVLQVDPAAGRRPVALAS